jgi:WD40 repeat protein
MFMPVSLSSEQRKKMNFIERTARFSLAFATLTLIGTQVYGLSQYKTFPTSLSSLLSSVLSLKTSWVAHRNNISSLAISSDGQFLVSGSYDKKIKIWLLETGQEVRVLEGHTQTVRAIFISYDGKYIFSGSDDKSIRIWDLKTGKTVSILKAHSDSVSSIAATANGRKLVSASNDGILKIWDLNTYNSICTFNTGDGERISKLSIKSDGMIVAVIRDDGQIQTLSSSTCKILNSIQNEDANPLNSANPSNLRELLNNFPDFQLDIAFSPAEDIIATSSAQNSIGIWNPKSGSKNRSLLGHTKPVNAIAFTHDGRFLVSGSSDKTIKLWDLRSGDVLKTLRGSYGVIDTIAISPNDKIIASGGSDRIIRIWKVN